MKSVVGAVVGFVTGMLTVVVSAGPLDMPWVGVGLAAGILAAGAWFMWEWGSFGAWVAYVIGTFAATGWLVYFPPADDTLAVVGAGVSSTWVLVAAVSAVFPVPLVIRYGARRGLGDEGADDVDDAEAGL